MMQKQAVPPNVLTAVNAILEPYGYNTAMLTRPNSTEENSKRYLSIPDVEKYCSMSRWTIGRAIKSGKLRAIKLSTAKSGKVLIDRADIDKWLQGQQQVKYRKAV